MSTVTLDRTRLAQRARLAQTLNVAWMAVELVVAVAVGVAARSVALTAFGFDSGIEIFTSMVVLVQLRKDRGRATTAELEQLERRAARLVGYGLYALIAYILISSSFSLITRSQPEGSTLGILLATAALLIMPVLWRWRLRLGGQLGNPALTADAACSAVCLYMAVALLVGLTLNRLVGWWWADPLAALAMVWWIRGEAAEALEASRPDLG